ncbi:hypothetical protein KAH81_01275 [bacterium]|nr:hypothetical protein [bacterium]
MKNQIILSKEIINEIAVWSYGMGRFYRNWSNDLCPNIGELILKQDESVVDCDQKFALDLFLNMLKNEYVNFHNRWHSCKNILQNDYKEFMAKMKMVRFMVAEGDVFDTRIKMLVERASNYPTKLPVCGPITSKSLTDGVFCPLCRLPFNHALNWYEFIENKKLLDLVFQSARVTV